MRLLTFLSFAVLLVALVLGEKCPKPEDIRSATVKNSLNISAITGTYYEIAYHDYTQPIEYCGCGRSIKSIMENGTIYDNATINCGHKDNNTESHTYHQPLYFHQTNISGFYIGKWFLVPNIDFPDTFVDVGPINKNGQYSWVTEF